MAKPVVGVWGIDVGQCALKALRLELIEGQVTATAFDYVEHPKILSQPDADPDQLIREALDKFLERNSLKGDQVAISVPGQSGLARFVKLPPVEEKKINDIVRFEAKQQIPFPLEEVIWDFQKIGSGTVTDGFAMETEIGLFAMKRDMINRAMQQFRDVNVEVHIVQMAPLALCNFVAYDLLGKGVAGSDGEAAPGGDGKRHCVVALDIGTDNSNLVISDGERIIWQRPIPHGGNHFTRALTKDLKLTFAKAEHLKRNATKSPDLKKILSALKPVLNDFVGEVQRSLGYFTNTHRNAQIDYMVGLGNAFRLPGLQKFLGEKLTLDVRKLQKLERLSGESVVTAPAFTQNVLSFAVAYGLALQGLSQTRLHTNLLPADVRVERLIRAKKPWAVAAAAAILLGTAAMTTGYALQYRAFAATEVKAAVDEGNKVVTEAKKRDSQFQSKLGEISTEENAVRDIVAGQDERLDWLLLDRYVNQCLPVPGERLDGKLTQWTNDTVEITDHKGSVHKIALADQPAFVVNGEVIASIQGNAKSGFHVVPVVRGGEKPLKQPGTDLVVVYEPDRFARTYWNPASQQAFFQLTQHLAGGQNGDVKDDDVLKHLIQLNLESVTCRWAPDLKTYWANATNNSDVRENIKITLPAQFRADNKPDGAPNPPDGAGWVVELRGYTFCDQDTKSPIRLLKETLINKLAAVGQKHDAAGGKNVDDSKPIDPTDSHAAWQRVIEGQVSHPFVYLAETYQNPEPGKFVKIGSSVLDTLLGTSSSASAGKLPTIASPQMMGAKGGNAKSGASGATSNFASLLDDTSSVGAGAGGGFLGNKPPMTGMTGGAMPPAYHPPTGTVKPGTVPPNGAAANAGNAADNNRHTAARTEFIVLLIWKEPAKTEGASSPGTGE
jgi:type IV pilus assembly protein PilM